LSSVKTRRFVINCTFFRLKPQSVPLCIIMVSEEGWRKFQEQMDKLGVLDEMKPQYVKSEELRITPP